MLTRRELRVKIVAKSGDSGYLPVETLSPRGNDPYAVVTAFLKQLREAIATAALN
jgi:hypothetical protein